MKKRKDYPFHSIEEEVSSKREKKKFRLAFTDEEFSRDSIYYVRIIQKATPAINGKQIYLSHELNDVNVNICKGSYKTNMQDDCLHPIEERAWSSPIFVNKP